MNPVNFPQANVVYGPPPSLDESQCRRIPAYRAQITGGSCDGEDVVVVAWKPDEEDMEKLMQGGVVYLSCIGGLPPHYLTTDFELAKKPA